MTVAKVQMPERGVFICRVAEEGAFMPGDSCLVELDYGRDIGCVLEAYALPDADIAAGRVPSFRVLRKANAEDRKKEAENGAVAEKAAKAFMLSAAGEKGRVKLLHARFSFDRDRFFLRYSAQVAVDLRRFQKQIERDYRTHVDLWQVGVRDEAAWMGCMGICGRPVCCSTWERQFQPVNVRMAKEQEMSMNPVSLNGSCGRLKCCLRFEFEQYHEAGARMPEQGSIVAGTSAAGLDVEGMVVSRDVMRGLLTVRTRDGRFLTLPAKDVSVVKGAAQAGREHAEEQRDGDVPQEPQKGDEDEGTDRERAEPGPAGNA